MANTNTTINIPTAPATQGNLDAAQLTNPAGTTVLRENVIIGDPNNFANQAAVSGNGSQFVDDSGNAQLVMILQELRAIKFVLAAMSGIEVPPALEESELQ